jgi:hypothetical protein
LLWQIYCQQGIRRIEKSEHIIGYDCLTTKKHTDKNISTKEILIPS